MREEYTRPGPAIIADIGSGTVDSIAGRLNDGRKKLYFLHRGVEAVGKYITNIEQCVKDIRRERELNREEREGILDMCRKARVFNDIYKSFAGTETPLQLRIRSFITNDLGWEEKGNQPTTIEVFCESEEERLEAHLGWMDFITGKIEITEFYRKAPGLSVPREFSE